MLEFCHSAMGVGDAITGLYVACGLADAVAGSGERVRYYARHQEWIDCAGHPGVEVVPFARRPGMADVGKIADYKRQIAQSSNGVSRKAYLCEVVARELKVPAFEPVRPTLVKVTVDSRGSTSMENGGVFGWERRVRVERCGGGPRGGYVVISPFSSHASREWGGARFAALARELIQIGIKPVAIGTGKQGARLRNVFDSVKGVKYFWGLSPAEVTRLVIGARVVVGNDSGIIHLAGMLGAPALCVHAGCLPHAFLFDHAPSVVSVTGVEGIGVARSDHDPAALRIVSVERVMEAVMGLVGELVK